MILSIIVVWVEWEVGDQVTHRRNDMHFNSNNTSIDKIVLILIRKFYTNTVF